jgi:4-alpha-glucanotransferase
VTTPGAVENPREAPSESLARLARACGVAVEYFAIDGELTRCSAAAIRAALTAMDIDASTDVACERSIVELEDSLWRRTVPPVTVTRQGHGREVLVHVPHGAPVEATLRLELGGARALHQLDRPVPPREVGGVLVGRATFAIPDDLPLGWHLLEAAMPGKRARGYVVVTPQRLEIPDVIRHARPWGFMTQLYSLRSRRSWGLGDLGDLSELCALAKIRAGADFVLINPLHANEPVPPISPSPYLPSSRRFLAPMYIRVEDIPEVAYVPSQQRAVIEWEAERPRRANGTPDLLDRDTAWRAKMAALEQVHMVPRTEGREAQFEAFCAREGRALEDFATWCAISEAHKGLPWPHELASPTAPAVAAWREEHRARVLFFAWMQWIADEQLARAQVSARVAGMSIGVMTDLAVGVHPQGADAWALQRVLAQGIGVGAPPDMYNQQGQNWSQPPWQPRALEAAAYVPYRDVVRAAVKHAGAVRIDHVLGLFRQWWVPEGLAASDGTYVQFDHEALVGIMVLEAHRAGAIVIGEDLGTVEPWVRDYLAARGVLGTSVMWFEHGEDGGPLPPERYRRDVLATVTTHDLPPTAAYLAGEHVTLREELGLLVDDPEVVREQARTEVSDLIRMLRERDLLIEDHLEEDVIAAAHRLVLETPALLVGVAITDAVGERRTQNQPGTFTEYPNWQVPLCDGNGVPVLLDELFEHPRVQRLVAAIRGARG